MRTRARCFEDCRREMDAVRANWPVAPDDPQPCRGELRLAAEVALAVFTARDVPTFAHERAFQTLNTVALA